MQAIFGAVGGKGGGSKPSSSSGGINWTNTFIDIAASVAGGFAEGGEIGKLVSAEKRKAPGKKPLVVVAHEGEQILSTKDKEAQRYRQLQSILGDSPLSKIRLNFADGGSILDSISNSSNYAQRVNLSSMQNSNNSSISRTSQVVNQTINVTTPDANSFRKTSSQIGAQISEQARRNLIRRGSA